MPCGRISRPTWWLLYAIGVLLITLLVLTEIAVPEGAVRTVLEVAVTIACFSLMGVWMRYNRGAVEIERSSAARRGSGSFVSPLDDALVNGNGWVPATRLAPSESSERDRRRQPPRLA